MSYSEWTGQAEAACLLPKKYVPEFLFHFRGVRKRSKLVSEKDMDGNAEMGISDGKITRKTLEDVRELIREKHGVDTVVIENWKRLDPTEEQEKCL